MTEPDVFVFLPVYRSGGLLPEAVRSLREQTYRDFRVLVSVEGGDDASLAECRELMRDDARFEIVAQPERLGWPGNFNWLVEQCDLPFLVYWQQDDMASATYLETLHGALLNDSSLSVAYSEVQWFGARSERDRMPSISGPPLARVLEQFEGISYVPLRGMIRAAMMPPAPAIRPSRNRSAQQEFIFLARLAEAGGMLEVDPERALYFKRAHAQAETVRMADQPPHRRLGEMSLLGAGVLQLLLELGEAGGDGVMLALVVDRLAIYRPHRRFFREPAGAPEDVRNVLLMVADAAGLDLGDTRWQLGDETGLERPIHPWVREAIDAERERTAALNGRFDGGRAAAEPGSAPDPARLAPHLGWGWHPIEAFGAWSSGEHASIELGSSWPGGTLRLEGQVFAPSARVRIGWSLDGESPEFSEWQAGAQVSIDAQVPAGHRRLQLHLPDAISPVQATVSADPRVLSFGLMRVSRR